MWERVKTWERVLPPSRPSWAHLRWFRKELDGVDRREPIGILGSTPELRDLVGRLGFEKVEVLERSEEMWGAMSSLRTEDNAETLIKGDWRTTLEEREGRYEALVSDLTGGNIAYEERDGFYERIAGALTENGLFLDKCLTHPIAHEKVEELLEKYEWGPVNWGTVNEFNCEMFFASELLNETNEVVTSRFYQRLKGMEAGRTVKRLLEMLPEVTPRGMRWYYGKEWREVRPAYGRHLEQVGEEKEEIKSPYNGRMKCITWRRR